MRLNVVASTSIKNLPSNKKSSPPSGNIYTKGTFEAIQIRFVSSLRSLDVCLHKFYVLSGQGNSSKEEGKCLFLLSTVILPS